MTIDTDAIIEEIQEFLMADETVRRITNFVKTGDWDMPSMSGIDIWIRSGTPIESENGRILFGATYVIPVQIQLLCRYRNREQLTPYLTQLVGKISELLYENSKVTSTNGYRLPINTEEVAIGEGEKPEGYLYTINVNYEMIVIPAS